jgi:hypothetical protein
MKVDSIRARRVFAAADAHRRQHRPLPARVAAPPAPTHQHRQHRPTAPVPEQIGFTTAGGRRADLFR